jgi:hypothetical protein
MAEQRAVNSKVRGSSPRGRANGLRLCHSPNEIKQATRSVGVAVISSAFHAEEHQFKSGTDYFML